MIIQLVQSASRPIIEECIYALASNPQFNNSDSQEYWQRSGPNRHRDQDIYPSLIPLVEYAWNQDEKQLINALLPLLENHPLLNQSFQLTENHEIPPETYNYIRAALTLYQVAPEQAIQYLVPILALSNPNLPEVFNSATPFLREYSFKEMLTKVANEEAYTNLTEHVTHLIQRFLDDFDPTNPQSSQLEIAKRATNECLQQNPDLINLPAFQTLIEMVTPTLPEEIINQLEDIPFDNPEDH